MIKRNFRLMAAIGAALSAGAAAVATAYNDDKLRVRHVDTEQECTFDTAEQLHGFMNGVTDPDKWQPLGQLAEASSAGTFDPTGADQLAAAIAAADQAAASASSAPASAVHVNLAIDQVREGAAPADAITVTTTEPAAPAADQAAPATEQPAADPAAQ